MQFAWIFIEKSMRCRIVVCSLALSVCMYRMCAAFILNYFIFQYDQWVTIIIPLLTISGRMNFYGQIHLVRMYDSLDVK